jgi:hypothetical protein
MSNGLEIRNEIATDNVKGLLLVNGVAAAALLVSLPGILNEPANEALARAALWALLIFQAGVVLAVAHNRLRRLCSLDYEGQDFPPPGCTVFGLNLREPCTCCASILCMWLSVAAFGIGGVTVFAGGLKTLDAPPSAVQQKKSASKPASPKR